MTIVDTITGLLGFISSASVVAAWIRAHRVYFHMDDVKQEHLRTLGYWLHAMPDVPGFLFRILTSVTLVSVTADTILDMILH